MKLGVHVSIAGSIDLSIDRARSLDLNTFQIFTVQYFVYRQLTHRGFGSENRQILATKLF